MNGSDVIHEHDHSDPGGKSSKVTALGNFVDSSDKTLVCTHATLRFAFDKFGPEKFNNCLVAIDEFHQGNGLSHLSK